MSNFTTFLAVNADWGKNLQEWVTRQTSAIAIAVMAFILIPIMLKRNWSLLVTTLFAGAVAMYFINNPETLISIGKTISSIILGS